MPLLSSHLFRPSLNSKLLDLRLLYRHKLAGYDNRRQVVIPRNGSRRAACDARVWHSGSAVSTVQSRLGRRKLMLSAPLLLDVWRSDGRMESRVDMKLIDVLLPIRGWYDAILPCNLTTLCYLIPRGRMTECGRKSDVISQCTPGRRTNSTTTTCSESHVRPSKAEVLGERQVSPESLNHRITAVCSVPTAFRVRDDLVTPEVAYPNWAAGQPWPGLAWPGPISLATSIFNDKRLVKMAPIEVVDELLSAG